MEEGEYAGRMSKGRGKCGDRGASMKSQDEVLSDERT